MTPDLRASDRARLTDALTVECPQCDAQPGEPCAKGPIRIADGRGRLVATLHPAREVRFSVERELAHSLVPPSRGGIYWCPGDTLPPPTRMIDDVDDCDHRIEPGQRRCACACVRLPPVAFRLRLLVFEPERRRVQGADGPGWETRRPIVLRIDAPIAARAYVPGAWPRESWDSWECVAIGIGGPETPGLWTWEGVLTVGWPDDEPDHYDTGNIDEPDLRWDGDWKPTEWPEEWRIGEEDGV